VRAHEHPACFALCDTLLPKLISGEVRVAMAKDLVEATA